MKKVITLVYAIILLTCITVMGQTTAKKESKPNVTQTSDGNYVAIKSTKPEGVANGKTYTDEKGTSFPVYQTSTGKEYISKTSVKTGKPYRKYLTL